MNKKLFIEFLLIISLAILNIAFIFSFSGCFCSKETTTTTVTTKDSLLQRPPVEDSIFVTDNALLEYLYEQISILTSSNDSLLKTPKDTVKIKEQLKANPFKHDYKAEKVTVNGDSIFITFKYDNGNGKFVFKEVSAKFPIKTTETKTVAIVKEKEAWYLSLWRDFKDYVLVSVIIVLFFFIVLLKFKKL